MGYMGYRSRGGAFEVKVIRVQLLLYYLSALGNVGTTKAVLSESSDDSNQALSMAILTSALGTGLILGPAVSGAISDPIGQYNLTITSRLWLIYVNSWYGICYADPAVHYFLTTFPYSLPCIVSMLLYIMSAVVVFIWLPETLGKKYKYYRWYCADLIVSFLFRASKSHRSENSMSNSVVATEKKDGFNGEAVPQEGHCACPDKSIEEGPNGGGEDESSHLCNGTVQDGSVQLQSTEPFGLCIFITNPNMCVGNKFPLQLLQ